MPVTPATIATLKKQCGKITSKKSLDFYFFETGPEDTPVLLMGRSSEIKKEKNDLVKQTRTSPSARGAVILNQATGGLAFEVTKGKLVPLQQALRSDFGAVPDLKGAAVIKAAPPPAPPPIRPDSQREAEELPKASLLGQLKGALKGGEKAFERRAAKIQEELRILEDLIDGDSLTSTLWSNGYVGIKEQLDQAHALAKKNPQAAYASLETVKETVRAIRQSAAEKDNEILAMREAVRLIGKKFSKKALAQGTSPLSLAFETFLKKDFSFENLAYIRDVPANVPDSQKDNVLKKWKIEKTFSKTELNIGRSELPDDFFTCIDAARQHTAQHPGDFSLWKHVKLEIIREKMEFNLQDPMSRFFKDYQLSNEDLNIININETTLPMYEKKLEIWRSLGL